MEATVMFIAGDPSGDVHASHVVRRLRGLNPGVRCTGIGGPAMRREGFEPVLPFEPFNCMGFLEVARNYPFFMRARQRVRQLLTEERPAALVLVDYPGFNLQVLRVAASLQVPVVWYITPKVWAWKEQRAAVIGRLATYVATIFPFEPRYFEGYKARVAFVGNPLVEAMPDEGKKPRLHPAGRPFRLALVPGSRRQEIGHMIGPMVDACKLLRRDHPDLAVTVSRCSWLPAELFDPCKSLPGVMFHEGQLDELLQKSDGALVTSGTATLEAALRTVPHVIVYRTSWISYRIARHVIRIPWIGLPNIVAGATIVPECIQDRASGEVLAAEMRRYVDDPAHYAATVEKLAAVRGVLGTRKPSEDVARAVLEVAGIA